MTNRRHFIRQVGYGAIGLGLVSAFPYCATGKIPGPGLHFLPRSTPEAQGISSAALRQFLSAVEQSGLEFHSIMLLRHGRVVAEGWWKPFAPELKHTLYSLSKSFTSTAIGMAVSDGKLSVEDAVISFFPDDLPAKVSDNLAAMKIKHLLTMNTGHAADTLGPLRNAPDGNWPKAFLAQEVVHVPGTHFLYNTGATYLLSNIAQRVMGRTVFDLLSERLFKPLQIEGADWETDPQGVPVGGYGLRVRTEDIAKFGQLYLQKGQWKKQQIVPVDWVEAATKKQTESNSGDSDWSQGYGYQFWRCKPAPGFYRGDGAFGQYCIVIPPLDAVVAITSESMDMQESMNLVWEHILPAMKDQPLPKDRLTYDLLLEDLGKLTLPVPSGAATSATATRVAGKEFLLDANEWNMQSVSFQFTADQCILSLKNAGGAQQIHCGMGHWVSAGNEKKDPHSLFAIPGRTTVSTKVAAAATWTGENTLVLKLKYIENIHGDELTCFFGLDRVRISLRSSISAGQQTPDLRRDLLGRV